MPGIRVFAGDCTTTSGPDGRTQRGHVTCLVKPDDTVLIHDVEGYQPAAWLTRPDALIVTRDPLTIDAKDGDRTLRAVFHDVTTEAVVPASPAGVPVGTHPDGGPLVLSRGDVVDVATGQRWAVPPDATVTDEACEDCGLPTFAVERGAAFEVCIDWECDPLFDRVEAAFDRVWHCPDCGDDLRIVKRNTIMVGCDAYPDCDVGFGMPRGVVAGTCDCGLPVFDLGDRVRCLDPSCDGTAPGDAEPDGAPSDDAGPDGAPSDDARTDGSASIERESRP